ncbi:hypothetical protein U1Q18_041816 [Sarracenia purpurea var. burkii]
MSSPDFAGLLESSKELDRLRKEQEDVLIEINKMHKKLQSSNKGRTAATEEERAAVSGLTLGIVGKENLHIKTKKITEKRTHREEEEENNSRKGGTKEEEIVKKEMLRRT